MRIGQLVAPGVGFAAVFVLTLGYLALRGPASTTGAAPPSPSAAESLLAPSSPVASLSVSPTLTPATRSPSMIPTSAVPGRVATATPITKPVEPQSTTPSPATTATTSVGRAWQVLPSENGPAARYHHSAVWTGTEMIVWGGTDWSGFFPTGARYNPATNIWRPMSKVNAPSPRSLHAAVWTGTEMVVWGGTHGRPRSMFVNDGGSYNPTTDTWSSLPPAPLRPRIGAEAVWTGREVIIWGGFGGTDAQAEFFGDGARYDPTTKTWRTLPTAGAPSPRWGHAMVWTGHDLLVWGGEGGTDGGPLNDGARFDPATNRWSPLPTAGAPSARTYPATAWTGKEMIVWGGQGTGAFYRNGARFNPATGVWTSLPLTGAPSARESATGVWTGSAFVVWGGNDVKGQPAWDGARYNPATNVWSPLPPAPLTPRMEESVTWTGHDLIVWGGTEDDESGARPRITPHADGVSLRLN